MPERMPKVNELLRQELSKMILIELGRESGLVTVTDVETTTDLQLAKVHISVFGAEAEPIRKALQDKAADFRLRLGRRLRMKFIPKLNFFVNNEERRERVEKLLEELP